MTPGERLEKLADLHNYKSAEYGDLEAQHGRVMMQLFPRGIMLSTTADFARFGMLVQIVNKVSRYANNFAKGHPDSLDDLAVYAAMLRSYDESK